MQAVWCRYCGWAAAGVLLSLPFLVPVVWFLVLPGLMVFLYCVQYAETERERFLGGYSVGIMHAMSGLAAIWHVYPLVVFGMAPSIGQVFIIAVLWMLFAASIGIGTAILAHLWNQAPSRGWYWLLFPFGLVLSEALGSIGFSLFTLGFGNGLNAYFSFGYVGLALAETDSLLAFARFGGVYALTFVAGTIAVLSYLTMFRQYPRVVTLGWLVVCAGVVMVQFMGGEYQPQQQSVLVVETYFDSALLNQPSGEDTKAHALTESVEAALAQPERTILLPEDSRLVNSFLSPEDALAWVVAERGHAPVQLIDSGRYDLPTGQVILRAHIFDTATNQVYLTDKQYLAPFGEYIPLTFLVLFASIEQLIEYAIMPGITYEPGPSTRYIAAPSHTPAVLFCMESVSTVGVRRALHTNPAPYVVHPTSHAWFHSHQFLQPNLERMLRVQAVWGRVPIISAGNMNPSQLYLPDGSILTTEPIEQHQYWSLKRFSF